ncbi:hypothetical protein M569_15306 [Genlisea aurea]|uniref:SNRNP25 ubiquitin-like domain-containing protein n=1 Tax=Genlisea aurea TaxID=192259 RepID=S8DJ38_9LAMI|nr:hypothetical protein M569_15306 [Genlisea aurea]
MLVRRKIWVPFSRRKKKKKILRYEKIPHHQNLTLSVLKLDGSSFSFQVTGNATVGGLKQAIEEEFSSLNEEETTPLWPLVWSHFCLCFQGQILSRDDVHIHNYGIKDGHQLHFIHHMTHK